MGKKKPAKRESVKNDKQVDGPLAESLLKDGELTAPFKQCLVEIFNRFDVDNDKVLSEEELQAFSSSANKDGHEFTAEEISDMKSMFDWDGTKNGLSLRGFVQFYKQQTSVSELESWSDLKNLGYDAFLKRVGNDGSDTHSERAEVLATLQKFSESSDEFVSFLPSQGISQAAKSLGFECRMLQLNGSEQLSVFKMPKAPSLDTGLSGSSPTSDKSKSGGVPVFSALELDSRSCKVLQHQFGELIPSGWTIYAHHMTICLGSLSDARSNGNPVSDDLQSSIRQLKAKDRGTLKVVSIGKGRGVVALGVIGCPSVNKVPHITLACANGHKPVESNSIDTWEQLSEFYTLTGFIREFEQRDVSAGLTASTKQVQEDLLDRLKHLEAEVLAARAIHLMKLEDSDEQTLRLAIKEREQELFHLKSDADGPDGVWEVAKSKVKAKAPKGKKRLMRIWLWP